MSNCDFVAARSLIDLATSRLALRASAPRAATALTRPNRSAQRLPCGRHVVPTAQTVGPNDIVANHGIERGDHLAHHRHDRDRPSKRAHLRDRTQSIQSVDPSGGATVSLRQGRSPPQSGAGATAARTSRPYTRPFESFSSHSIFVVGRASRRAVVQRATTGGAVCRDGRTSDKRLNGLFCFGSILRGGCCK